MFGSFLPSLRSSSNQSVLRSREPTLLCNHVESLRDGPGRCSKPENKKAPPLSSSSGWKKAGLVWHNRLFGLDLTGLEERNPHANSDFTDGDWLSVLVRWRVSGKDKRPRVTARKRIASTETAGSLNLLGFGISFLYSI